MDGKIPILEVACPRCGEKRAEYLRDDVVSDDNGEFEVYRYQCMACLVPFLVRKDGKIEEDDRPILYP